MSSDYDIWGVNPKVAEEAGNRYKTKHGMFAGVPILCKDNLCPYLSVCSIAPNERVINGRCPMEAGAIVARFNAWCKHFKVEILNGKIKDEDLADVTLIKDLVENEVQTLRAENKIAINADFLGETISQIDNKGKVYRESTVTPEAEYRLALQEKKYKILQLLNATRKDRSGDKNLDKASQIAKTIFNEIKDKLDVDVENIDFEKEG